MILKQFTRLSRAEAATQMCALQNRFSEAAHQPGRGHGLILAALCLANMPTPAAAEDVSPQPLAVADADGAVPAAVKAPDAAPAEQRLAIHAQGTFTLQGTPAFASPYSGTNSLAPGQAQETIDATLFLGLRLWKGAEVWANPEIDQGFGLSDTLGVAGFVSGEAYKVGKANPYFKLPRLFLRQTIALGGTMSGVDAAANQLAGHQSADRIVITIGKFGVADVFDTNAYAHDPRGDFLNWAIIDTGSFDYAANSWGYTYGASAEWYQGDWTLRAGLFNLSKLPNDEALESDLSQYEIDGEIEHRHSIAGHPGAIRLAFYRNYGRFEKLSDAVAVYNATGIMPDPATLRRTADRWGGQINVEQEVNASLGVFLRAGYANGGYEAYDFTDIDRTLAVGGQLKGNAWGRPQDKVGFAGVVNGISKQRQQFLADGGLGILVGDGALPHPGNEWIMESYYDWQAVKGINVTVDYQFVQNPGYNRDRGPAHVFGFRLHGAF